MTTDLTEWLGPGEASRLDPADLADLEVAIEAVLAGGREVMRRYRSREAPDVEEKAPDDPVTEADRAADRAIRRALERRRPGESIRSEETMAGEMSALGGAPPPEASRDASEFAADASGDAADAPADAPDHLWIVDPLDGTKEFLSRNGEFTVMVGLAVAGGARLGAVYRPDPGVLYLGCSAGGAWRGELREDRALREDPGGEGADRDASDDDADEVAPEVQGLGDFRPPVALSVAHARDGAIRVLHSRSHRPEEIDELAERLGRVELVPSGSAGLKCARVAADEGDLYVHPVPYLKEWDTCAPDALLRGAGGRVTDCRGERLRYGKEDPAQPEGLFAARPDVWERAADVVRELAPSAGSAA